MKGGYLGSTGSTGIEGFIGIGGFRGVSRIRGPFWLVSGLSKWLHLLIQNH